MKNLVLRSARSVDVDLGPSVGEDDPIAHFCADSADQLLYAATRSGVVLCLADAGAKLLWSAPLFGRPPGPPGAAPGGPSAVCALSLVPELDALFAACSGGELLLLHTASREVEEVGVISGGLAAASWSPDGELLALLGLGQLLLLMNKEWEVLAEVALPAPVGAAAAPPRLLSAALTWRGDSRYFASNTLWEVAGGEGGCGAGGAAGAAGAEGREPPPGRCRLLHVWDREGCQLHAAGEPAPGLAEPIAWQPNSRHLYAAAAVPAEAQRRQPAAGAGASGRGAPLKVAPHQQAAAGSPAAAVAAAAKSQRAAAAAGSRAAGDDAGRSLQRVLLFERNGLQHGGFDVPTYGGSGGGGREEGEDEGDGGAIHSLHWSNDSELLAVVLAPDGAARLRPPGCFGGGAHEWRVQLWHRSNWHWYLKHEQLSSLPDSAGGLLVSWDDVAPGRLHLLAGSGAYCRLDFDWGSAVSSRGTAAVVDGHQLLITPLRHCLVPPPMCAVRALLPRPANAVAWLDGDVAADLGGEGEGPAAAGGEAGGEAGAGVLARGLCEVLAVLLSDGGVVFLRSVESDLWEETLEDQAALGGPSGYLLPLGFGAPAAWQQQQDEQRRQAEEQRRQEEGQLQPGLQGQLSMPSGPWTPPDGGGSGGDGSSRLRPLRAAGGGGPAIPPAEGRVVLGLVWLGAGRLLLLAAPYPAQEGLEQGEGTVLVEAAVDLPPGLPPASGRCEQQPPGLEPLATGYAGGCVLCAASHPAGGALLELRDGALLHYAAGGRLSPLPAAGRFPAPCRSVLLLPGAQRAAPAVGLAASGALYWGRRLLADDVTSAVVRGGGPGGPALLFVTRQSLLYVVMEAQLPTYQHQLPTDEPGPAWRARDYPGDLRAAMSQAMRPGGAAAAARDPHVRAVEQGAAVLASPWGGVGAVLQMQRGNLEGVCPRLLVLAAVCDALDRLDFAAAWRLAVSQRADLNLLADYRWPRFLHTADDFVRAVRDPSDLCDLLFALRPGSVLREGGAYAALGEALGWRRPDGEPQPAAAAGGAEPEAGGKVNAVCGALRAAVLRLPGRYFAGHLKTVVISHARSDPPSLESALLAIREVKEASAASAGAARPAAPPAGPSDAAAEVAAAVAVTPDEAAAPAELGAAADSALAHLLLYADVDALYRTALGLYDLPLAFMVISRSQKDPGEYIAELTRLGQEADEHLRRHAIDVSLGRHDRALANLVAAGPRHFGAALELASGKGLLRQLLALTQREVEEEARQQATQQQQQQQQQQQLPGDGEPGARDRLVAVLQAHGQALLDSRKAEDAAVAFSAAGLTAEALGAYRDAGAWRMCMVLSARLGHPPAEQQALARSLAEQLQASGAGADAAQLLVQYLGDVDGGVAALVAAKEWREALRVAYAAGRADLVDTLVVPGAAQAAAALLEEAGESVQRLSKYGARLAEVRQRRCAMEAALAAAGAEAEAAGDAGADDAASEAPSLLSGLSMYTDRTAGATGLGGSSVASSSFAPSTLGGRRPLRHERRAAKKGRKIRAGGPGEEAALAAHLATLVPARHALEEAGQLAELLVMLGHVDDAAKLQQRVGQWQAAAAAALQEAAKGQQQQQQQQPPAGGGQVPGGTAAGSSPAAQQGALPGTLAAAGQPQAGGEVRWKWDVLREHR